MKISIPVFIWRLLAAFVFGAAAAAPAAELEAQPVETNQVVQVQSASSLGGLEIIIILVMLAVLAVLALGFAALVYLVVRSVVNRPAGPPPTVAPAAIDPNQEKKDAEQLRLLAVFHFVFAGFALIGIGFIFVHYTIMHAVFANPEIWKNQKNFTLPKTFFDAFVWFYLFIGAAILTGLVSNLLSGLFLLRRRNRLFSLVVAAVNCLQIPFGTALGVFTILVLSRESVRQRYGVSRSPR